MHETEYSQVLIPRRAIVLGLELRPYSLAHELWLIHRGNELAGSDPRTPRSLSQSLIEAVLICHHTHAGILRMDRDPWMSVKLMVWRWRIRKLLVRDLALEAGKFLAYRARGMTCPPLEDIPGDSQPSRPPGSPFLQRLKQFLVLQFRITEEQALDYPLARAQWEFMGWLESQGCARIQNSFEAQFDCLTAEVDRRVAAGEKFDEAFVKVRAELEGSHA